MSILKIRKWRLNAKLRSFLLRSHRCCARDLNAVRKKPKFRNI